MVFSLEDTQTTVKKKEKINELDGSLAPSLDPKLMRSVLQGDKKSIDEGKLVNEAMNRNIMSFTPDLMCQDLVSHYRQTERLLGPTLIRLLSGYSPKYIEKNVHIPEFSKELKKRLQEKVRELQEDDILDKQGFVKEKGMQLASLVMYVQEIEHLMPKGLFGQKVSHDLSHYGEPVGLDSFRKGDRYRDLAIKQSVRVAVKRGHNALRVEDLRKHERQRKGTIQVVYALDASASMKGRKLSAAKRAGVALSFRALQGNDEAGLLVFGSTVRTAVRPTKEFHQLLSAVTRVTSGTQTNFPAMLERAQDLFSSDAVAKHLLIITDALPTEGAAPHERTLMALSAARDRGVTVSMVGIGLDKEGEAFARECVALGAGRLYVVRDLENIDTIVLEDYDAITA